MRKRLMSILVTLAMMVAMIPSSVFAASDVNLPEEMNGAWGGEAETDVVYYNDGNADTKDYYPTMAEALNAVFMSSPADVAKVYCKPGADLGKMTHAHVADNIDICGNGAYISGGEYDMEFDTYKYDRATGKQSPAGEFLTKDITVNVNDLNGIAAWGQRNTDHTVNVNFTNCKNMNRVYVSGTKGTLNISLVGCSFEADKGSHKNTSVYSNAPGDIVIKSTLFSGVAIPVNLNNKSEGVQNVTITDSEFVDCSTPKLAAETSSKAYAAPVRIVVQPNATTNLNVDNLAFNYSGDKPFNGDILLGDGRASAKPDQGIITFTMSNTNADVQQQKPGYFGNDGNVANPDNVVVTTVEKNQTASMSEDGSLVVKDPTPTEPSKPGKPQTPEGGEQGAPVETPDTSDNMPLAFSVFALVVSSIAAFALLKRKKNN